MKKNFYLSVFALILCVSFQSCFFEVAGVGSWRNKNIDQDVKDEIAVLNKELFKMITTGHAKGVKKLMSDASVKTYGLQVDTLVKSFSALKAKDYRVLDEYYVKNPDEVSNVTLKSNREDNNDYLLNFVAINTKTYVSVLVTTGLPLNCMILAIYGKYGDAWKLNILRAGNYSAMDQTASDHYESALKHYQNNNYIDAVDMIVMASILASPGGDKFEYLNNTQMKELYRSVLKEASSVYHFPFVVNSVKSKPQIFAIGPQFESVREPYGIFPAVKYKTSIPLADTNALKAENKELQKVIGVIFKGIDKNKPGIIYQVYNKFPDDSTAVDRYTIVQKLGYAMTHSY